jgi:hypothetical protein
VLAPPAGELRVEFGGALAEGAAFGVPCRAVGDAGREVALTLGGGRDFLLGELEALAFQHAFGGVRGAPAQHTPDGLLQRWRYAAPTNPSPVSWRTPPRPRRIRHGSRSRCPSAASTADSCASTSAARPDSPCRRGTAAGTVPSGPTRHRSSEGRRPDPRRGARTRAHGSMALWSPRPRPHPARDPPMAGSWPTLTWAPSTCRARRGPDRDHRPVRRRHNRPRPGLRAALSPPRTRVPRTAVAGLRPHPETMPRLEFFAHCAALEDLAYGRTTGRSGA